MQEMKAMEEEKRGDMSQHEHLDHFDVLHEHEHADSLHHYFLRTSGKSAETLDEKSNESDSIQKDNAFKDVDESPERR
jgi:hypothetical protein